MDELEHKVAMNMLRRNVDKLPDDMRAALLVVVSILDGLEQRIIEMQDQMEDGC